MWLWTALSLWDTVKTLAHTNSFPSQKILHWPHLHKSICHNHVSDGQLCENQHNEWILTRGRDASFGNWDWILIFFSVCGQIRESEERVNANSVDISYQSLWNARQAFFKAGCSKPIHGLTACWDSSLECTLLDPSRSSAVLKHPSVYHPFPLACGSTLRISADRKGQWF